ncbi:MAG: phosphatidylserine decarboxylase [Candidatus Syntropharchaeia archaeon]
MKKGERIGIIRFGSRVDLLLPEDKVRVIIKEGESVKAGVDTIAKIHA